MLLVCKMNTEEREEGEITEYEDISSDEEILLRQRIAEIEATNLELEKLASLNKAVDNKENSAARRTRRGSANYTPTTTTKTEVVALTNVSSRVLRSSAVSPVAVTDRSSRNHQKPKPAKRRRTYKRSRKQSYPQLITSDDEFASFDQLPLGTENLSPDPLPIDDDEEVLPVEICGNVVAASGQQEEDEEDDDDLELKLRLEALRSKQEIKNELQIILDQTEKEAETKPAPHPPPLDEEQELRLIALKSAMLKKHQVRKKRKEEARPYSPTDALENIDVPSPPPNAQNMDISPIGTPSPVSEVECHHPVDMEIANSESQSPIFFSCTINTEPNDPTALSRVDIQLDASTMVPDSGYDDEDPDKLRAFLLEKIGEAAKRKSMRVCENIRTESSTAGKEEKSAPDLPPRTTDGPEEDEEDELVLRANLLSKAKQLKRARVEEPPYPGSNGSPKPLSEILNEQSKKAQELKSICRTIPNEPTAFATPIPSPKQISNPPTARSNLINQMPPTKVQPVIISLRASDGDSTSEFSETEESLQVDAADNASPLSIAMDSPRFASSPIAGGAENSSTAVAPEFDAKLSEFLKKARDSTGCEPEARESSLLAINRTLAPVKRIVTKRRIVKKVVNVGKSVGLASSIQLGAPASVKHLPPSTQLEYNRLINRMHHLERQKMLRARLQQRADPTVDEGQMSAAKEVLPPTVIKGKPSPVKAPLPVADDFTVVRRGEAPKRTPITVLVHNGSENKRSTVIAVPQAAVNGGAPVAVNHAKKVAGEGVAKREAAGRLSLKDRLKSLTGEQKRMLQGVQQRKVVNKRMVLDRALDTFLATIGETMEANRQQMRVELEVRRLRRMLKAKEEQLAEQRQKCSGPLHVELQAQYKTVAEARQSLAATSAQCLEIGRSVADAETEFRLTEEGSEGLLAKYKKYKAEIEAYKEMRAKLKKGAFTVNDLKAAREAAPPKNEKAPVQGHPHLQDQVVAAVAAPEQQAEGAENSPPVTGAESAPAPPSNREAGIPRVTEHERSQEPHQGTFPVYKSPLEHMEFLDNTNPHGILCPFELNGVCVDEGCLYRHLGAS